MYVFIIVCMLLIVGFVTYSYKVMADIAKHMEETLIQHDIELAKVHYKLNKVSVATSQQTKKQENKKTVDKQKQ